MAYLDDELAAEERRELELHLLDCAACRDHVDAERKSRVALRARLAAPPAPALLRARIERSLDAADKTAAGVRRTALSRWILPGAGVAAAAAALVVFVAMPPAIEQPAASTKGALAAEAVREQAQPRPLEVHGADTRMWLARNVRPGVEVPRFDDGGGIREVGARRVRIAGHEGAQVFYQLPFGPTSFELQAYVFADVDPESLSGSMRVAVESGHMWVTELDRAARTDLGGHLRRRVADGLPLHAGDGSRPRGEPSSRRAHHQRGAELPARMSSLGNQRLRRRRAGLRPTPNMQPIDRRSRIDRRSGGSGRSLRPPNPPPRRHFVAARGSHRPSCG